MRIEAHRRSAGHVALVAMVLALAGTPRPANAQGCTKDIDCKGTRVCEDGRCVEG